MRAANIAASIAPLVRISLYLLTGLLAGAGGLLDAETVALIRADPTLLSLISMGIAVAWYGLAKWFGWAT